VGASETDTREQWASVEAFLADERAIEIAAQRLRRRGAFGIRPTELVSEAWLRLSGTFDRRAEPYEAWDDDSPARLVARAIDAALIDLLRRARPTEVIPVGTPPDGVIAPTDHPEQADAFRSMIAFINDETQRPGGCAGCRPDVVAATALAIVHQVAAGAEPPGRGDDLSRLLGSGLREVLGEIDDGAIRQRRRRCGPCVRRLIEQAMGAAGLGDR
jgi:hypothetical protein